MSGALNYAVVDQGSTATKAALCDTAGRVFFEASETTPRNTQAGRMEIDADALGASVERLLARVIASGPVGAIGLTCQRSTCLVWDRQTGHALTPALSWQDTSQTPRTEAMARYAADIARRTGLRLSPHYAATKLAQLLSEVPDGRARAAQGELVTGTLDAFLMQRLTGAPATEPGHAGRTLLYNLSQGGWDPELCKLFGIPQGALPNLRTSAGYWGKYRGIPVCAGAGDQQAALIGHGGWKAGTVAVHFGTGAFVLVSTGLRAQRHRGLLSSVLASTESGRRFQLEGSVNSAGSAVDWACSLTGENLAHWADRELVPERLPWVVPAFTGLGAPWWRPRARGLIHGLSVNTPGADVVGGVLLGIAMRVVDNLEAMAEAGARPAVVRLSGKLTRLRGLVDLISDAAKVPIEVSLHEETGLLGICRLAAAGLDGSDEPLDQQPLVQRRRDPQWSSDRAGAVREAWRALVSSA